MPLKGFNKREILKYAGDFSQLFGIRDCSLNGGKAEGMRVLDVKNGSGLEFAVLPSRALDIAGFSYKCVNFSFISDTGLVAPQFLRGGKDGFNRNFHAGFLYTCGLNNVGSPCEDDGEELSQHGILSYSPAEQVCAGVEWDGDIPVMKVRGLVRESSFFGENLVLEREIKCTAGDNKVFINDTIENSGFKRRPLMVLYHFNLGYPLLDSASYISSPTVELKPRDEEASKGLPDYNKFQPPTAGYAEQVFYHKLGCDSGFNTAVAVVNPRLNLGAAIRFNTKQLKRMTQWKQPGEGEYVLGIEPCNCFVGGRADCRKKDELEFIEPGEKRSFNLVVEVLEGTESISDFENYVKGLQRV